MTGEAVMTHNRPAKILLAAAASLAVSLAANLATNLSSRLR
jgi:hypothetical protein